MTSRSGIASAHHRPDDRFAQAFLRAIQLLPDGRGRAAALGGERLQGLLSK
jgi:hypothetical protein